MINESQKKQNRKGISLARTLRVLFPRPLFDDPRLEPGVTPEGTVFGTEPPPRLPGRSIAEVPDPDLRTSSERLRTIDNKARDREILEALKASSPDPEAERIGRLRYLPRSVEVALGQASTRGFRMTKNVAPHIGVASLITEGVDLLRRVSPSEDGQTHIFAADTDLESCMPHDTLDLAKKLDELGPKGALLLITSDHRAFLVTSVGGFPVGIDVRDPDAPAVLAPNIPEDLRHADRSRICINLTDLNRIDHIEKKVTELRRLVEEQIGGEERAGLTLGAITSQMQTSRPPGHVAVR